MSLDVYLTVAGPRPAEPQAAIFVRRAGAKVEISRFEWDWLNPGIEPVTALINADDADTTEVYSSNITHNLGKMAAEAGIYEALWRPDENGITKAAQLIGPLSDGVRRLRDDPEKFDQFNAPNGWGKYENFVPFVENYLAACRKYPDADVRVSR